MTVLGRIRPYAWLALVLSLGAMFYSIVGLVMAASLAAPSKSAAEAMRARALAWESSIVISGLIAGASIYLVTKSPKRT
jgi:hypothetical protein